MSQKCEIGIVLRILEVEDVDHRVLTASHRVAFPANESMTRRAFGEGVPLGASAVGGIYATEFT
jgi:hypothetical protein